MNQNRVVARAAQPRRNAFGDMDRAVAPAGTADCDGDIAFAFDAIARERGQQELLYLFDHGGIGRVRRNIGRNRGVLTRLRAQFGHPMRVLQKAHVEHQIGVARQPAGKAKTHDGQHRFAAIANRKALPYLVLKIIRGIVSGIDHMLGPAPQRFEHFALAGDAVGHRPVIGERVPSPVFGKAAFQFGARAIEKQHRHITRLFGAHLFQLFDQSLRAETARSGVDADRQRAAGIPPPVRRQEQIVEERNGQIVDNLPAQILQHFQRRRFACTGKSGDNQQRLFLLGHRSAALRQTFERQFDL
jgi:hypothetical protein